MAAPGHRSSSLAARTILSATLFALASCTEAAAFGLKVDVVPSLRVEEGWDSNVFNSVTGEVSSLSTRVTPGVGLNFTTPDGVEMRVSGNYEKNWYTNPDAKHSNSDTFFFRIDSSGAMRLTPLFSVVPSLYYLNTTNSFRRTQLVPSGDPVVPQVSITNYGNTDSREFGGGVRVGYMVTQNFSLGLSGTYGKQRFENVIDNGAQIGLTNSSTYGMAASVSRRISPRTNVGLQLAGSNQKFENRPDSATYSAQILLGHQFSPAVQVDGGVGVEHLRNKGDQGTPAQQSSKPTGTINVTFKRETFSSGVFGSAVYSGANGYGETARQLTAGMRLSDRFARDWTWNLSGTYQYSRSAFDTHAVNIRTIEGETGLTYSLWRWANLDLVGNAKQQSSEAQFGGDVRNYSARLGFTARYPFNIY